MKRPVRVGNCSGFYGDRLSAAREMVDGGPLDVLSGDWLAELTMLILAKNRARDRSTGFARTFVTQMEDVMGDCLRRGIKVVSNAGGLAPGACADAIRAVAVRQGLEPVIATVAGDDLLPRIPALRARGVSLRNLDTGAELGDREIMTANAYLGGWGIADALDRGADIVITGRVTDAALAMGPAAWWHGWGRDDWGALAGACVAGHVIECGAQATGGNYSFFREIPGLEHAAFPVAEIAADGSSTITKHPGCGGAVTVGTVTAQLLYEINGAAYLNPDVTARFDTITLSPAGDDRVAISGVRGESPPPTSKVALNYLGGHRTTVTVMLAGLDIEEKAELFLRSLWRCIPGGRSAFEETDVQLWRSDHADPASNDAATAQLRITVRDGDERKVGRSFTGAVTELGLATYPGFFVGPAQSGSYGVYWPTLVPSEEVPSIVEVDGEVRRVPATIPPVPPVVTTVARPRPPQVVATGPTRDLPLGRLVGARSGDKGGNANVGLWVRSQDAYDWLVATLTVDRLMTLLPETAGKAVHRYELPNLLALNFVIEGLLGLGVAANSRVDGQAKSLGEYLRAKVVAVPVALL